MCTCTDICRLFCSSLMKVVSRLPTEAKDGSQSFILKLRLYSTHIRQAAILLKPNLMFAV